MSAVLFVFTLELALGLKEVTLGADDGTIADFSLIWTSDSYKDRKTNQKIMSVLNRNLLANCSVEFVLL